MKLNSKRNHGMKEIELNLAKDLYLHKNVIPNQDEEQNEFPNSATNNLLKNLNRVVSFGEYQLF